MKDAYVDHFCLKVLAVNFSHLLVKKDFIIEKTLTVIP